LLRSVQSGAQSAKSERHIWTVKSRAADQHDHIRIYNRALSPTEVHALYHLGTATIRTQ
jgi:hypothetical protein